jgi:hypothetical protein
MTTHTPPAIGVHDNVLDGLPRSYRGEWRLFTDWCTAFDVEPLASSAVTVARFLAFEPKLSRAAARRRVSAINTAHRLAGASPPGTVTAVRALLSARDRHRDAATAVMPRLPVSGWPAGLFGRRDVLILTLVCHLGIPVTDVGDLRCGDVTINPATTTVHIGRHHQITAAAEADRPFGVYGVWQRWAAVRELTLRRPSPIAWSPILYDAPTKPAAPHAVSVLEYTDRDAALLPAFDRWGNPTAPIGDTTTGLSPRAVSAILRTHLQTPGRPVTDRSRWANTIRDRRTPPQEMIFEPPPVVELADTYADGIDARRRAATELGDLDDVFTALDHQMAALLHRTEQLLDHIE